MLSKVVVWTLSEVGSIHIGSMKRLASTVHFDNNPFYEIHGFIECIYNHKTLKVGLGKDDVGDGGLL